MKSKEIKAKIETENRSLMNLIEKEDLEGAKAKKVEIRKLMDDLEKAEKEEKQEEEEIEKRKLLDQDKDKGGHEKVEKRSYENAAKLLGEKKVISTRAIVINGETTNAVVPETFLKEVETLKAGYGSLKQYCEVIPVSTPQGKRPVSELGGKLSKLTPGQKIPEGDLSFTQITYDAEAYGEIIAVDRDYSSDAAVDLFATIRDGFAVKSVNTENAEILTQVNTNCNTTTIDIKSKTASEIIDAILAKIDNYKPSVRSSVKILADTALRSVIKNAKATDGHKDERVTVNGDKVYVEGKEVIEFDTSIATGLARGYVIPMKAIKFFDRKAVEIRVSDQIYFDSNADAISITERFDVVPLAKDIVKGFKIVASA